LKNELTQAIGTPAEIHPDYNRHKFMGGDRILLCSDGLWDLLSDEEINQIVYQPKDLKEICTELIDSANEAGGHDNITVMVIESGGPS
jgi:protein phosphatase